MKAIRRSFLFNLLVISICLSQVEVIHASDTIIISDSRSYDLAAFASVYSDIIGNATTDEVITKTFVSLGQFQVDPVINYYWLKVTLKNALPAQSTWRLGRAHLKVMTQAHGL